MPYLTIFSDASFDHLTKASGYAYWIRDDQMIHRGSGGHAELVDSSAEAETIALCIAIVSAIRTLSHQPGDIISLQSDCLHALKVLVDEGWKGTSDTESKFREWALRVVAENGLSIKTKHIKAHTGFQDRRSYVNTFCDQASRRRMRFMREKIQRAQAECLS